MQLAKRSAYWYIVDTQKICFRSGSFYQVNGDARYQFLGLGVNDMQ